MRGDLGSPTLPGEVALTAKEQAQWMLHRLVPDRGVCNIVIACGVERELRWWPLQEALNHLLYRHPALRAVLDTTGPVARKTFVPPDETFPLSVHEATEDSLGGLLSRLAAIPFALDGTPLVRAHLVLLPGSSVVSLVTHHLVSDYVTASVLIREVPALYDGFATTGQPPPDLADIAPVHLESPPDPAHVAYWVRHLAGYDPQHAALAGARPIIGRPTFAGAEAGRPLPAATLAALRRVQERTRVSQNMVLLAAFYLLLARNGAGRDVVVGVPVTARWSAPKDVVGFHASTLPMRVDVDPDSDAAALVRRVSTVFLQGLDHGTASFEAIVNDLPVRSGDWRVPLFRHSFNNRSGTSANVRAGNPRLMAGGPMYGVSVHHPVSRLDLEWIVWPHADAVHVRAAYSTEVHEKSFVDNLHDRYQAILREMADGLDRPLRAVHGWSAADAAAYGGLRGPVQPLPRRMVAEQVRAVADTRPDAPALRDRGRVTTYRQLVAAAERVRRDLAGHGLRPGEPVALLAARGPALAAGALGVWAAGGAYLPMDPAHPAARLVDQLDDAGVRLVLTDGGAGSAGLSGRTVVPLPGADQPDREPESWPAPRPEAPAYVIYTSGSTGAPKGVEVSHGSLANLLADFTRRLAAGPGERTLWLTTFSFDISALELFLPLCTGGTVVVAPDEDRVSGTRLLDLIADEGVDVVQATPTAWRQVAGALDGRLGGRRVLTGGEPLPAALAQRLLATGCRLFHVYGPTETTIWSTAVELTGHLDDPLPLGAPVANTTLRVLDPDGCPVPPGVPGELYIGGAGVASGYRGQPALTAQRFPELPSGRSYRTGDRVELGTRGLVFLGRLDRQVKVRGHRLELTEVEAVLQQSPHVRAAAVVTEPDGAGHLRLVAAVVPQPGADPGHLPGLLRSHLARRLPNAAVPSRFVPVPALPHTANGKVDHRAVGELVSRPVQAAAVPADPQLRRLVELWRAVLGDASLGPDADFFLHGGHSLLATALAERVGAVLGRPVGFEAVFESPSPARLLAALRRDAVATGSGARG